MIKTKYHLHELHFELKVWVNELIFYKEEVSLYENRLEELVRKYTDRNMLAQLERFQNQFIRQKEVIDELKHEVKAHENILQQFAQTHNEIELQHTLFEYHNKLKEDMITFKKLYTDVKNDFMRFAAQYM